jgi:membrane protein implicated in regulation of membrane protease activity
MFWAILGSIFLVAELLTVSFFYLWFGVGAFTALAFQLLHFSIGMQIAVFITVSLVLVLLSEKIFKKYLLRKGKKYETNVYSIIGSKGVVTKDIKPDTYSGEVIVNGRVWTAISNTPIKKGTRVIVKKINGVKLEVETEKMSKKSKNTKKGE